MKIKFFTYLLLGLSMTVHAQIDSQNKSTSIPAIKSDKGSPTDIFPLKSNTNDSFNGLTIPKKNSDVTVREKEFSMFGENFGNPGELYEKKLNKKQEELRPEGFGEHAGLKEDAYWGDYKTKSEYIDIACRDYGLVDGDILSILVDDDIVRPHLSLTENFKGFRLNLKEGFNKIEFYAVNEGYALPNTAEYKILDQWNNVITAKIWALSSGIKVTVIIVKE